MTKPYSRLEKENKRLEVFIYVLLAFILVLFTMLAMVSDKIDADFTDYENKISELEAKNKVLSDELSDIEMSGARLKRIPAYER